MEAAALALRNLAQNKENKAVRGPPASPASPDFASEFSAEDASLHATAFCPAVIVPFPFWGSLLTLPLSRGILPKTQPQDIVATGAVPPLVEMLAHGNRKLKEGAAAALAALGTHDSYQAIIANAGAIPLLVALLLKGGPSGREAAALALCNLSWHIDIQVLICRAGGVAAFAAVLANADRHTTPGAAAAAAGAVDNLTAVSDANKAKFAAAGVILPLVAMSQNPEAAPVGPGRFGEIPSGKTLAAQALRNLSAVPELKVDVEIATKEMLALRVRTRFAPAHALSASPVKRPE